VSMQPSVRNPGSDRSLRRNHARDAERSLWPKTRGNHRQFLRPRQAGSPIPRG